MKIKKIYKYEIDFRRNNFLIGFLKNDTFNAKKQKEKR